LLKENTVIEISMSMKLWALSGLKNNASIVLANLFPAPMARLAKVSGPCGAVVLNIR